MFRLLKSQQFLSPASNGVITHIDQGGESIELSIGMVMQSDYT